MNGAESTAWVVLPFFIGTGMGFVNISFGFFDFEKKEYKSK